ncbi:uncharacterized protein [Dermacentor andersoni]|uniref:uncharacterized protein n=1 Tax=Dermacentor andersoni TaxID=34620 RepID=UPI00241710DA|nr:angiomotin-like [Dermacentor andersoni]
MEEVGYTKPNKGLRESKHSGYLSISSCIAPSNFIVPCYLITSVSLTLRIVYYHDAGGPPSCRLENEEVRSVHEHRSLNKKAEEEEVDTDREEGSAESSRGEILSMATDQKKLPDSRDASTIPPRSDQSQDGSEKKKKKKKRRLKRDDQVSHPSCLAQESTTPSQQSSTASVSSSTTLTPVVSVSPKTIDSTSSASGSESVSTAACEPAWLIPKGEADVTAVNVSSSLQQKSATEGKSAASARELVDPRPTAKPERLQSEPSFGTTAPPGAPPWSLRSSSRVWGGSLFDLSPSTKMDETTLVIGSRASAPELFGMWSPSPSMEPRSYGVASKDSATAPYPMRQSLSATTSRRTRITMPSWLFSRLRGPETPGGSSVPSAMPPLTGQPPYGVGTESGGARSNLQVPYTPTLMSTDASTHLKNAESRIAGRKDNRSLSFCQLDDDRDVVSIHV